MNYGQYETERRLKSLSSKTGKYTSKLVFNIFKAFFILFLFLAVAGAAVGFGMIKGIIDNAPSVDIMNIQPDRFATTVYDADGNLVISISDTADNFDLLAQNLEWHNKKIKEVSRLEMLRALPRELIKEIRKSRHKER